MPVLLLSLSACPVPARAADDGWVRTAIFDGRASIEVPPGYLNGDGNPLQHMSEQLFSDAEAFYVEGLREAWIEAFQEEPPRSGSPFSYGSKSARAHFFVAESVANDLGAKFMEFFCPDDFDSVRLGWGLGWGIVYAFHDPRSGLIPIRHESFGGPPVELSVGLDEVRLVG